MTERMRGEKGLRILDEKVIEKSDTFTRVLRYVPGHHPELGKVTHEGWTPGGKETIIEKDLIKPAVIVEVVENDNITD